VDFVRALPRNRKLRIGVANNFKADREVRVAFEKAVEIIRKLGYPMSSVPALFGDPSRGMENIEADRKAIAGQAFKDIDVLLLPTTTTTVPTVREASGNPQALSAENTSFANYYSLPAISLLCGFDANGLPLGLQIVGKPWGESAVLRLAYQYQAATDDLRRYPYE
jgi:aspartyl-tRNA(Asn)/glutamyl-tRNA(Gln) amidotransferase subunit A